MTTFLSYAKSCSDCHATAGVCSSKGDFVTCSCTSGYIGNGVNCTAISSCSTESCCPAGYYWDNRVGYKVCTDINECANSTLNKCIPSSTCINRNGIHLCSTSRSIACTSSVCPFDQDCLNVGGTVQCADPCSNYQTLNGTTRLSTIDSTGVFATDRYNFGWFRYTGSAGLRMQEGCVGILKCGSLEPFSLNGSHPAVGEGVKMVPLTINSLTGCVTGASIPVKACPGNFFIYKFTGSVKIDVFCTDPLFTETSVIPTISTTTTTPTTTSTTTTTPTTTTTTPTTTTTTPTTTTTTPTTTTT
ncbi:uromodulin-like, partial [Spea bombifrons]|uniref:uromodulin-like n=1 Tax=Spea bombifrons TaxID=233779 RepID=UPI002348F8BB